MTSLAPRQAGALVLVTAIAGALAAAPPAARAYSGGAPDGYAGNPPDFQTCTDCHGSAQGDGNLALLDLPALYAPGVTYDLRVRIEDPGQRRWGFELTVLDLANAQGGTLVLSDPTHTQLSENPGPEPDYVKQTSSGTFNGSLNGPIFWPFRWTAPAAGDVVFYLAGNAANGNNNTNGDYIYSIVVPLGEAAGVREGPVPVAATRLGPSFPNPLRAATSIPYELAAPGRVTLRVYDVSGRLIANLIDREAPAGRGLAAWDGRDAAGRRVASGAYYLALDAGGRTARGRVVVAQ